MNNVHNKGDNGAGPGANGYIFLMFLTGTAHEVLYQSARGLWATHFELSVLTSLKLYT
jgi:hypothetical protein